MNPVGWQRETVLKIYRECEEEIARRFLRGTISHVMEYEEYIQQLNDRKNELLNLVDEAEQKNNREMVIG